MAVWSEVRFSQLESDIRIDGEYYKPKHLELDELLAEQESPRWGGIEGEFIVGPFGSAFHVENYVESSPYRYVRGRDVKPFFLLGDENCYISEEHFQRLRKHSLEPGDLLISVVGTLGNVSIVNHDVGEAIFSCKSTAFRSHSLDPKYLCAYLNSRIGQSYLQRMVRGHVQTGLNLSDLKMIPIFHPSKKLESEVAATVRKAYEQRQLSAKLYAQTQESLLEDLGLEDLDLSATLFYKRPFAETQEVGRLDAEFFQPKYYRLLDSLDQAAKKRKSFFVSQLSKPLKYGTSDKLTYIQKGTPFLRIADLENRRFELQSILRISRDEAAKQKAARIKTGDVLISRSGTLGLAVAMPPELDKAVFGSYFIRVRPDRDIVYPEFFALYINSLCGSEQIARLTTGAVQTNLTIPAIENIRVISGDLDWQRDYVDRIEQSVSARQECRRLLEESKQMIERVVIKGDI